MKNNKTPKWVLFDQLHIDVTIRSDMPAIERKDLTNLLSSEVLKSLFETVIIGPHRKHIKVKITR